MEKKSKDYSNPNRLCRSHCLSATGDKEYTPIDYVWDDEAKCKVPTKGKTLNRYAMIQASKAKCDINDIVKRASHGDVSVLNVNPNIDNREGVYNDISDAPNNLNDAMAIQTEAINNFMNLDPKVRAMFDNDIDKFAEAAASGTVNKIIAESLKNDNIVENKEVNQ